LVGKVAFIGQAVSQPGFAEGQASIFVASVFVESQHEAVVAVVPFISGQVAASLQPAHFAETSVAAFLSLALLLCALTKRITTTAMITIPVRPIITFFISDKFIWFSGIKNKKFNSIESYNRVNSCYADVKLNTDE
jgi:hypothetical protein